MSGKAIIKPVKGTIKVIKATGQSVNHAETTKKAIDVINQDEIDIEFDDADNIEDIKENNTSRYRENNLDNEEEEEDIDRLLLKSREESNIDNASTIIILPVKTVKKKPVPNKSKPKTRVLKSKVNKAHDLNNNDELDQSLDQDPLQSLDQDQQEKYIMQESLSSKLKSKKMVKVNNLDNYNNQENQTIRDDQDESDHEDPATEDGSLSNEEDPATEEEQEKPAKKSRKKASTKKPAVKKGPGRPRKIPKKEPMPRNGIKSTSINPDSSIEFLYDTPIYIKKLLGIFKSLAASKIQIVFRPTDIVLYATDHHKKSKMRIRIDASKLNHYYCKSILDIGILEKDLELIMNKVDSGYSSIVLVSTNGNTQKNITLILENDIQIDENHTIELIGQYDRMDNEAEFTDENYAIKFNLPGKYFRKTISDIKTMSNQLSITQEDNEAPLILEYSTENGKIHSRHTVNNSDKIKLKSQLADGESFRVDMKIDYIKPISSAHISDEIMILVDENKKFMTKAFVDNGTIEIKTITEIIDSRKPVEET